VNPLHIRENLDIFDFSLTDEEMDQVRQLDKGFRFFRMTLEEQEANLGWFVPAD
jgi:diketogulonate reductase-like aldo/keto reductase